MHVAKKETHAVNGCSPRQHLLKLSKSGQKTSTKTRNNRGEPETKKETAMERRKPQRKRPKGKITTKTRQRCRNMQQGRSNNDGEKESREENEMRKRQKGPAAGD